MTYEQALYNEAKQAIKDYRNYVLTGYQGTFEDCIKNLLVQSDFFML